MESNINLLPTKDKQLKRGDKPAQPEQLVEMTKPDDRVFQERVVRVGGVLEFFKRIFKRAPKLPAKAKPAAPPPPPPAPKIPHPAAPVGLVTRLETMSDRLPTQPRPTETDASFFTRLFSKSAASASRPDAPGVTPRAAVPPPPPPPAPTAPVRPEPKRQVWAPPPPPPPPAVKPLPPVAPVQRPSVPVVPAPPPPPAFQPVRKSVAPARPEVAPAATNGAPVLGQGLNVNLVPEEFQPEVSPRNRLFALITVGSAILLVTAVSLGLYFYQRNLENKVQRVDEQYQQALHAAREYETVDLQDALVLKQRANDVRTLLSQHVYWDEFFKRLEAVTLPNVAYSSMSVDISGTVTLNATAKSFNDVGDQLLTFQRATDFITDVTISTATRSTQSTGGSPSATPPGQTAPTAEPLVTFSISMHVVPTIFYR